MLLSKAFNPKEIVSEIRTISFDLFKLMIPIVVLVKILELLGFSDHLAQLISPFMSVIGLPAEMGVVWAGTMLSNIYTGMVLFITQTISATLSVTQVTVLGILMLFAHSLPVELRIAQKIGIPIWVGLTLRVLVAYLAAWLYFMLSSELLLGEMPANIIWNPVIQQLTLVQWAISQCKLFAQIVLIIAVLVVVLRLIRVIKADRLIHLLVRPVLPFLGLTPNAVNITLVGMTLGLTYGGGLLLQESRQGKLGARELFYAVCFLLICHSLIEDTVLILLLGADIYGILVFRVVFSFIVISAMVFLLRSRDELFFSQRLLNRNYQVVSKRPG